MTDTPETPDTPEEEEHEFGRERKKDILLLPLGPMSLVGSFFHKLQAVANGKLEVVSQGLVVAEPQAGVYLCEIDFGGQCYQRPISLSEMQKTVDEDGTEFRFYDSEESRTNGLRAIWADEREQV